jgi:GT2 family glycosyltransferase
MDTDPVSAHTVDVIVPVYNAPEDARRCLEAVLAHTGGDFRLVVIDDASPDPGVAPVLRELEARGLPHESVLRNERNLGFTGTANRAMARSRNDVVLLNSDALVGAGWLDALRRCARSDPAIGTITPFSNNAEILSFPEFCVVNPAPDDAAAERIAAALSAAAVPTYPDLPTGVGFCMFVRRALIDAVGTFDPAFGAGYGEENDLCLRAARAGWRNVLADDVYVRHTGGRSFAGRKDELAVRNMPLLLERHPHYLDMVRAYVAADPLRPLREAALLRLARDETPGVLHVVHHAGGGTETHVRALIAGSKERWRHCLAVAVGDAWTVEEHRHDGSIATYAFHRAEGESWPAFVQGLCATFAVALVHVHNLSACRDGLLEALAASPIPYGYTVHDFNFACPTITFLDAGGRFCGAQTDAARCAACLAAQAPFAAIDIERWRARHAALVAKAAFLVAPSRWAARTFARYFPGREPTVIPHGAMSGVRTAGARQAVLLPGDAVPTVAVLGAIGPDKGARTLERLVERARVTHAPVRFVLIGYLDVRHEPWQSDDAIFTVHGRYAPGDLPELLAHYRVALVLYPSIGPETFSYTLTEAWQAGRPVLVPPIGALAERVAATGAGVVLSDAEWRDDDAMLARILALVHDQRALQAAASCAPAAAGQHSQRAMAEATLALYRGALESAGGAADERSAAFAAARVRDALGYAPWLPPASGARDAITTALPAGTVTVAHGVPSAQAALAVAPARPRSWLSRLARYTLSIRRTPAGRALYRIAPQPLLDLLKGRL